MRSKRTFEIIKYSIRRTWKTNHERISCPLNENYFAFYENTFDSFMRSLWKDHLFFCDKVIYYSVGLLSQGHVVDENIIRSSMRSLLDLLWEHNLVFYEKSICSSMIRQNSGLWKTNCSFMRERYHLVLYGKI